MQIYVSTFRLENYPVREEDILHTGVEAFAAALNTVNIGKFNLCTCSIGMVEHAFYEAITHAQNRILYGNPVTDFAHVRANFVDSYARIVAMKLFSQRSVDYLRSASLDDRRYLLFNPVTKAKVTMEGETIMRALHDVVAAKGYEKNTMFREVAQLIGALPRLEGTVHVNVGLVLKFMPNYMLNPKDYPEIPTRNDPADDVFFWNQGPTRGAGKVQFADWAPAYERHLQIPNVARFYEQAQAFKQFLLTAAPDADQLKDLDFLLDVGHLFSLIVYGQLILEQAALTGVDNDIVDQIFDFQVRDFSTYAVAVHGKSSSTQAQQDWALGAIRKPVSDAARFGRVWERVKAHDGAYEMRALSTQRAGSLRPPLFRQHQLGQWNLHLLRCGGQPFGDPGLQPVEELCRPRIVAAVRQRCRQRRKHRRPDEGGPQRAESVCVVVDLVLRPESVLGVEHLEMFDGQPLEPAGGRERGQKVRLSPPDGRQAHATHFVLGQQSVGDQFGQRVDQGVEQWPVAELAVLVEGHRQHDELPAGTQLATTERDELVPVVRGLLGVRRAHAFVGAVGHLHVVGDRRGNPAQPLDRPRRPAQVHAVGRDDLAVERPPDRRGERRGILAQICVRVVGQRLEHHGEVVVRHVGVHDENRMFRTSPAAQHRECRRDGQQRVVSGRCAVVGDDDRLRLPGQRHRVGGLFEKRYRRTQSGRLQPRADRVRLAVDRLGSNHHARLGYRRRLLGHGDNGSSSSPQDRDRPAGW